jgi:hypothetical protein
LIVAKDSLRTDARRHTLGNGDNSRNTPARDAMQFVHRKQNMTRNDKPRICRATYSKR